jgi:hypothetical protein
MEQSSKMTDQYPLRLPDGWRDTLKAMAKENRRSMNSEIICCLEPHVIAAMSKASE